MMSNIENNNHRRDDDDQVAFREASNYLMGNDDINAIRNKDPRLKSYSHDFHIPNDMGWELLGRYIANNKHLEEIDLEGWGIVDVSCKALFRGLTMSSSIKKVNLAYSFIGVEGISSMMTFLENSPNLCRLYFDSNANINTECFGVLMSALNGSASMEELWFKKCNIEDVSALNTYTLPNLLTLDLSHNHIGEEGWSAIGNLLQNEESTLKHLYLESTGMGDGEAEIIANSLKHNTTLKTLELANKNIGYRGCVAFLKLLNDISSIDSTYNSNHTLTTLHLSLPDDTEDMTVIMEINIACRSNRGFSNPDVGRAKVIRTQLNSQMRKQYCRWQGIEYSPSNLFADIEPVALLPNILELISNKHGQSELYAAIVPLAPDLMSYIDRKAMIESMMADRTAQIDARMAQIAALTAERDELSNRLELIKSGGSKHASSLSMAGKKRERSDS